MGNKMYDYQIATFREIAQLESGKKIHIILDSEYPVQALGKTTKEA